ncbi:MAG: hypothetical protein VX278_11875, partial [Myxococcota bacterium]|nr:hypothetical protein [Myxococcota bacterium]
LLLAFLFPPTKKNKILYNARFFSISCTIAMVSGYLYWAELYYPIATSGHDMPLQNAVGSLGSGTIFLEGWVYRTRFYSYIWVPLGSLAFLSPLLSLPALGLSFLHMSVPEGHGVDRSWGGHCHHMAPAAAFAVAAISIGGFRLLHWMKFTSLRILLGGGFLFWSAWWWHTWGDEYYNLIVSWKPEKAAWVHPAWKLAKKLPPESIPVVSTLNSIVVSNYPKSYTYDESLYSKARHKGLSVATHMIYDKRKEKVKEWVERMPGYRVLEEEEDFILVTWHKRSLDIGVHRKPKFSKKQPYVGPYSKGSDIPGVPPKETRIPVKMNGSVPAIRLWKSKMIKGQRNKGKFREGR